MTDRRLISETLDSFRQAVRDLASKSQDLEVALARIDEDESEDRVNAVRVNQVLVDEAYSKYDHLRRMLYAAAGWD